MTELFKEGVITFDPALKEEMLALFGIVPDKDGYLVDKDEPWNTCDDDEGNRIHISEFAGLIRGTHGELIIIKSDLPSLIRLLDKLKGGT